MGTSRALQSTFYVLHRQFCAMQLDRLFLQCTRCQKILDDVIYFSLNHRVCRDVCFFLTQTVVFEMYALAVPPHFRAAVAYTLCHYGHARSFIDCWFVESDSSVRCIFTQTMFGFNAYTPCQHWLILVVDLATPSCNTSMDGDKTGVNLL